MGCGSKTSDNEGPKVVCQCGCPQAAVRPALRLREGRRVMRRQVLAWLRWLSKQQAAQVRAKGGFRTSNNEV